MVAKKIVAKKKVAAKKSVASKKVTMKKAVPAKKIASISAPMTKTMLINHIAAETSVVKKDVAKVFDTLADSIEAHLKKRGPGQFTLPGLMKITTVTKPARRARKGINPFTGEETVFKARPAQTVVKVRPLKRLKEMAGSR